ncbi:MAG: alpha/beta hydrolase [Alphaproteobacteria bacterium]|nr:alpha/beta hydrolase [Alphaproteobacteria bacterium]MBU4048543.1 alpha/beta hydrolase [Alphaproteobacteria bacterium]MBU4088872.1 alpha/beta hydrolase [Alphaproteobacteria bacterium]MBU4157832.1 alpha/beta hydrolase [Alphaproteobacteria bacterium]
MTESEIQPSARVAAAAAAARPVTFSGTVGLFMPAAGKATATGVLFVSPWGLEEMCMRKFWRVVADALAGQGMASLRFDYPGTGDATDRNDYVGGLSIWEDCVVEAAQALRRQSGCRNVIVVSQGLGSALAVRVADRIEGLTAIACLAPVTSGRAFLREMQIWARMVDEGLGVPEDHRLRDGVGIAGLRMPDEIAADLRKLSLSGLTHRPAPRALVVKRADRPADTEFSTQLTAMGVEVREADYTGYDEFISNPAISTMPDDIRKVVLDWIGSVAAALPSEAPLPVERHASEASLLGPDFRETPVNFGDGGRLYGMLCEPLGPRSGATVVILGTAYDRHAGWGRSSVMMARNLAAAGVASLRFDGANIGDSPPVPGVPDQVLYQDSQIDDVRAALDFLARRDLTPVVVSGRCSGGYLTFKSAVADQRVSGAIAVNPFVFHWQQGRDIDESLRYMPRSLDVYREKMFQTETFRRLLEGRVDIRRAIGNMGRAFWRRVARKATPVLQMLPGRGGEYAEVRKSFQSLAERKMPLYLLYSENDVGFEHFAEHFGPKGQGLRRFSNAHLSIVPEADHNFTPAPARRAYLNALIDMARRFPPGE